MSEGVIRDMSDEDYHKQLSRDEHFYSSSQLKTMLEDPQKFYEKYILGKSSPTPQAMQDAFDVGTLTHTAILEPDKLKGSYTVWEEGNRTGKIWNDFKAANEGKLILNKTMKASAENAIKNAKKSKLSMGLFKDGEAETSFFLLDFHGIRIKVRTDWLNTAIVDLKTTTGNVRDPIKTKNKIKQLNYDLSAALYVDVVNACIDHFNLDIPRVKTFYWVFTSKDKGGACQVYDAYAYLPMGRAKYMKAIELIKHHEADGWKFPEEIIELQPYGYEVSDWITPQTTIINEDTEDDEDSDLL